MRRNKTANNNGFTLVELIVAIAIVAILATASIVGTVYFVKKASQSKSNSQAEDIRTSMFVLLTGHYYVPVPSSADSTKIVYANAERTGLCFYDDSSGNSIRTYASGLDRQFALAYNSIIKDYNYILSTSYASGVAGNFAQNTQTHILNISVLSNSSSTVAANASSYSETGFVKIQASSDGKSIVSFSYTPYMNGLASDWIDLR